jgi:O-antigen ligase
VYFVAAMISFRLPGGDVAIVASLLLVGVRATHLRWLSVLTLLSLFVGWCLLSALASAYRQVAMDQSIVLVKLLLVSIVAANVLTSVYRIRVFLGVVLGFFLLFPVRGAIQNYLFGYALFGRAIWNYAYANPNDLAAYAIVFSGFAGALSALASTRWVRVAGIGSIVVLQVLVLMTQSRAAILASAFTFMVLAILRLRNLKVGVAILGVSAGVVALAPAKVWTRIGGLKNVSIESGMRGVDEEGSAEQRFQLMKIAAMISRDYPILGVGPGAYAKKHAEYAMSGKAVDLRLSGGERDAHNTFLRVSAETGLLGLLLFCLAVGRSLARALRPGIAGRAPGNWAMLALGLSLMGYLIAGLFGSYPYINVLYLLLVLIAALEREAVLRGVTAIRPGRPRVRRAALPFRQQPLGA